jgi:hypothetical protein
MLFLLLSYHSDTSSGKEEHHQCLLTISLAYLFSWDIRHKCQQHVVLLFCIVVPSNSLKTCTEINTLQYNMLIHSPLFRFTSQPFIVCCTCFFYLTIIAADETLSWKMLLNPFVMSNMATYQQYVVLQCLPSRLWGIEHQSIEWT